MILYLDYVKREEVAIELSTIVRSSPKSVHFWTSAISHPYHLRHGAERFLCRHHNDD
jgi:hypothetical protein